MFLVLCCSRKGHWPRPVYSTICRSRKSPAPHRFEWPDYLGTDKLWEIEDITCRCILKQNPPHAVSFQLGFVQVPRIEVPMGSWGVLVLGSVIIQSLFEKKCDV